MKFHVSKEVKEMLINLPKHVKNNFNCDLVIDTIISMDTDMLQGIFFMTVQIQLNNMKDLNDIMFNGNEQLNEQLNDIIHMLENFITFNGTEEQFKFKYKEYKDMLCRLDIVLNQVSKDYDSLINMKLSNNPFLR